MKITCRSPKTSEDFLKVTKVLGIRKAKHSERLQTACQNHVITETSFTVNQSVTYFKHFQVIGYTTRLSIFESATCHLDESKDQLLFNLWI